MVTLCALITAFNEERHVADVVTVPTPYASRRPQYVDPHRKMRPFRNASGTRFLAVHDRYLSN